MSVADFRYTPSEGPHHLRVRHTRSRRFGPYCDCGWVGPTRRTRAAAVIDFNTHLLEALRG